MRLLPVLLIAAMPLRCTEVEPRASARPPSVVIEVRGPDGRYVAATTASLRARDASQLDLMCVVADDEGVRSAALSFVHDASSCTLPDGAVYRGTFTVASVPASQLQ